MLVRLLYASRVVDSSPETIESILTQSRQFNPTCGITGILCYGGGIFFTAKVFVESTSAYETQGAGKDQSMSLQITDMEIGKSDKAMTPEKSATMLYGTTE